METLDPGRQRKHAERMLQRAQKRQAQAAKLVEKWQRKVADLDRAGIAQVQPRLWPEESDTIASSDISLVDSSVSID